MPLTRIRPDKIILLIIFIINICYASFPGFSSGIRCSPHGGRIGRAFGIDIMVIYGVSRKLAVTGITICNSFFSGREDI